MLERIFSRGGSRQRAGDAVDQGVDADQRDALRERSATILQRLERRQMEARRVELERRRLELEAAERAEHEAAERAAEADMSAAVPDALPAEETGMAMPQEAAVTAEPSEPETQFATEAQEVAPDPEVPDAAMDHDAAPMSGPEEGLAEAAEAEEQIVPDEKPDEVAFMPIEDGPDTFGAVKEDEPAEMDVSPAEAPPSEFGETDPALVEPDSPPRAFDEPESGEPSSAGALFAESGPLRSAANPAPEHDAATADQSGDAQEGRSTAHLAALADEDPEAYEALCRKAEEAKARIAKRLEVLKAEEEANAAASLLDIGAAAPPLAPDHDDE